MLSVAEALSQVLSVARLLPAATFPVADARGLVLAEEIASDIDSPPYDKALMDGYAVIAADLATGDVELGVLEEVPAGAVPRHAVVRGVSTRIMTGAPLPAGADCVVMFEETERVGDARVRIRSTIGPGKNIMPRGLSMRAGETILKPGVEIRPVEIGLLCEVGRTSVRAIRAPRVGVLATGDEVVEPGVKPAMGQIRNSNSSMVAACVASAGAVAVPLGIARDNQADLRRLVALGLENDMLILMGGVSAGTRDLVPEVLAEQGVKALFHKIHLKPGKPLLFGIVEQPQGAAPKLVFGLPGNPVSGLVCFELFVRPALRRLAGHADVTPRFFPAALVRDFAQRGDRPTYHPAQVSLTKEGWRVAPVDWQGSPDLRGAVRANALVHFPPGDRVFAVGERVEVLSL